MGWKADPKKEKKVEPKLVEGGFHFGSYGRVGISSDANGGPGRQMNIARHGPRLGEGPYLELDLYYRLRELEVFLPPLRERKEDIALLVDLFIDHLNEKMGRSVEGCSDEVLAVLGL